MPRPFALICSLLALLLAVPAQADPALDSFARDVDRTESLRAVLTLQRSYAQYAQAGLWREAGALFTSGGQFIFDGQVKAAQTVTGPGAIAAFLRTRYGGGHEGLRAGDLSTMMIDAPLANLSAGGESAKVRWQAIIFHGHSGAARIEGGVFENDYVRERGVWKIATAHYYPQYDGAYEDGWTNWGGGDLPIPPAHYTVESAGIPIPPATGTAPAARASLAALQKRVDALNEEDRIRNLQAAYGFYADRRMWDDVVDLFAADSVVENGGQGVWRGKAGVRRWLESIGPAGLSHGQLNDRVQFDVTVTIAPGGNEAYARGIELGMLGEADQEKGWWEVAAFRNRFVRENGVWKLRELRRFPLMKTDIFQGWGKSRIVDPVPAPPNASDAPSPDAAPASQGLAVPAFLTAHPVTGKAIALTGEARLVAAHPLTGAIRSVKAAPVTLDEARRRLARSAAWDGANNVSTAYGYYIDDGNAAGFAGVMAEKGFKETPFAGYYIGRDRIIKARVSGPVPQMRPGISYHWLVQPVILVSADGRSTTGRSRLFQPRTGREVGKAGDFYAAAFWGGMYNNQYVLENGVWRIWDLTLDEPYINPVAWKDGVWAKSKDPVPPPPGTPQRVFTGGNFPPDVPLKSMGRREEGMRGGIGPALEWPSIMPMWFNYTNPVSGRVPERYQEDCGPCEVRPDLRLDRNGYQTPPNAPIANSSP
ncbi:nuclear transport factor 2 family protein [Sphingobium nicotianae]|uniref:Nuclear transport factor 2 family protein n=1 Tax=Sphingobium nicotianae TaxID=2782607 RepID=A0A9X1IS49_9SPHN|nr:nuclear transport factor 2 family protein [Sphingobium nicotianae]MBT2187979.1 nuclear transport factor 2 family protein [Sphingobium nicotianae]